MDERFFKCLKTDCRRKVPPGVAYCCAACQASAQSHAPWEVGPYDPEVPNWVLVHSEFCEARKAERGELDETEAITLAQDAWMS